MKIGQFNNEISSNEQTQGANFRSFPFSFSKICSSLIRMSQDGASAKYPPIVFRDLAKYESLLSASA